MASEEDSVGAPVVNIPGGTRWIKVTAPHPAQVVKVKKTTGIAVFYVQERPGDSQGKVGGTHRSDRQSFLRDYEPYTKRDWDMARRVMAAVEREREAQVEVEEPEVVAASNGASEDPWASSVMQPALSEAEKPGEDAADEIKNAAAAHLSDEEQEARVIPAPRRSKPGEIAENEQEEMVELWRAGEPVPDIANTYSTMTQVVYAVVSTRVPAEYALQRTIDQLKRNQGPIPAYQISQWTHLSKPEVEAICTSEDAVKRGIRYSVEVRDPARPWIKTPMVELAPPATPAEPPIPETPESEITVATPANKATPTEAPVQFVITEATTNSQTQETPAAPQQPGSKFYRLVVRTTIEDRVLATDITNALEAGKAKYAGRGEVVAVMEE